MKKLFIVSMLALTAFAFSPSSSITTTGDKEIHIHNIAEAREVTWQCRNCGMRVHSSDKSPAPSSVYGCGNDFNKRHIWERIN